MSAASLQVRWERHEVGVLDHLRHLLTSEAFADVTLCCQGRRLRAHRVLLSACSPYLQRVLLDHPSTDHVTIILHDILHEDMRNLLLFMYTGSAVVSQEHLGSFLRAAETLDVKVLASVDRANTLQCSAKNIPQDAGAQPSEGVRILEARVSDSKQIVHKVDQGTVKISKYSPKHSPPDSSGMFPNHGETTQVHSKVSTPTSREFCIANIPRYSPHTLPPRTRKLSGDIIDVERCDSPNLNPKVLNRRDYSHNDRFSIRGLGLCTNSSPSVRKVATQNVTEVAHDNTIADVKLMEQSSRISGACISEFSSNTSTTQHAKCDTQQPTGTNQSNHSTSEVSIEKVSHRLRQEFYQTTVLRPLKCVSRQGNPAVTFEDSTKVGPYLQTTVPSARSCSSPHNQEATSVANRFRTPKQSSSSDGPDVEVIQCRRIKRNADDEEEHETYKHKLHATYSTPNVRLPNSTQPSARYNGEGNCYANKTRDKSEAVNTSRSCQETAHGDNAKETEERTLLTTSTSHEPYCNGKDVDGETSKSLKTSRERDPSYEDRRLASHEYNVTVPAAPPTEQQHGLKNSLEDYYRRNSEFLQENKPFKSPLSLEDNQHRGVHLVRPLPSLRPISNLGHFNGQIVPHFGRPNGYLSNHPSMKLGGYYVPHLVPDFNEQISKDIQNHVMIGQSKGCPPYLKDTLLARGLFDGKGLVCMNGFQKPAFGLSGLGCVGGFQQRVPRLSAIVPPSPWSQPHRPPCAAPTSAPAPTAPPPERRTPGESSFPTALGWTLSAPLATGPAPESAFARTFSPISVNLTTRDNCCETSSPKLKQLLRGGDLNNDNHNGLSEKSSSIRKRPSDNIVDVSPNTKEQRVQEPLCADQKTSPNKPLSWQELPEPGCNKNEANDLSPKTRCPPRSDEKASINSADRVDGGQSRKSDKCAMVNEEHPRTMQFYLDPRTVPASEKQNTSDRNVEQVGAVNLERNCDISEVSTKIECAVNSDSTGFVEGKVEVKEGVLEGDKVEEEVVCVNGDTNNNKSHGCEDCGKQFSRRQLLLQHRRIHTGERPYACAECGKQFTQRGHWSAHQKLHEPARRAEHACTSCGKAFVTRASLKVHLRTHTGEKPFQCTECGKQFSQLRNYKYHRSVHEGTREFAATCPECGKYFNDRGYLSSHMKIHRNRKEYECQYCGKSFNQRVAYNMHVRIHTGERPHSCLHCSKSFSRKMLLKQHLRIHTGEKPFACEVCGKAFADRSNMTLHMRLHSGIKPYTCTVCSKAFTKKHHLKTHMNYHTGIKPYACDKCGLRFSQSSNMRTHFKKCTSTMPPSSSSPPPEAVSPAAVITPPQSDESSCGSNSVIPRHVIEK